MSNGGSGGFKSGSGFRSSSNGYQNRNGNSGGGFRNGGDKFGDNRNGGYGNNQSFGGKGLKSVEWGVKNLKPVNKPAYVPHSAIVSRSPYEVGRPTIYTYFINKFNNFVFS